MSVPRAMQLDRTPGSLSNDTIQGSVCPVCHRVRSTRLRQSSETAPLIRDQDNSRHSSLRRHVPPEVEQRELRNAPQSRSVGTLSCFGCFDNSSRHHSHRWPRTYRAIPSRNPILESGRSLRWSPHSVDPSPTFVEPHSRHARAPLARDSGVAQPPVLDCRRACHTCMQHM